MGGNENQMENILKLLSANGIKYQSGFAGVLDADYSDDPAKYALVEGAVEQIRKLALDCINHGKTREKQADIFALSSYCVELTKPMKSKKVGEIGNRIATIRSKTYVAKNAVDIRGPLVEMVRDTADGLDALAKGDLHSQRSSNLYREAELELHVLANEIEQCYDNYSVKAAEYSRIIFKKVYEEIRNGFGNECLTISEFRSILKEVRQTVQKWNELTRAGEKVADKGETYTFDSSIKDPFYVLVRTSDFLEKFEILEEKTENYRAQTEIMCSNEAYSAEREQYREKVKQCTAGIRELKEKLETNRISKDEALQKGRELKAQMDHAQQRADALDIKISANDRKRESRSVIYDQLSDVTHIIKSNTGNPKMLWVYYQLTDLKKINQLLTGTAATSEQILDAIKEIRKVLEADHTQQLREYEMAMEFQKITLDYLGKISAGTEQIDKLYKTENQVATLTDAEKTTELENLFASVPEVSDPSGKTVSTATDLDELLK